MKSLPTLLIVDDTKENLALLKAITIHMEVNVIEALSGSEALKKTRGIELALAIIDVRMPEMSGYELAIKLNEDRIDDKVPVIFLTAIYSDENEVFKGYNSGAVDYIFKPTNSHILLSKINVFLDIYSQKQRIIWDTVLLKKTADELKESEEKFRTLFQNHSAIKLIIDPDNGNIVDANFAAAKFYGWPVEKLKTMNISEINTLSPAEFKKELNSAKNNVKNYFELKHLKADGSIWDVGIDCGIITLKGKRYLHLIVRNITEHKKLEEERKQVQEKLRAFAAMLQDNREQERKSIAREIHDEFGQVLTAIKINLTMLGKETTKTVESSIATSILSEIDNMKQIINQTIHKVRVFTNKLRPDVLDTFGLFEALDTHISEFDKLHGIKCNFVMPDEQIEIDSDKSIAVYRIVQEALTNVARHAKATEVDISISKQDNFLNVSIEDNGKGIERAQLNDAKSFGIIGMKERAYICGGTLLLTSEPGKGTKIDLSMPIKEND